MKSILLKLLIASGIFLTAHQCFAQNLLADSTFTGTSIEPYYYDPPPLNKWVSWVNSSTGTSFTTSVENGVCTYFIDNPGINTFDVQLTQYGFPLKLNHRHRLSFDVKADAERDFGVFLGEFGVYTGTWRNLNPTYLRHATKEWQTITIDVDAITSFDLNKLSFEMGIQKINMYFRNVSLMDIGPIPLDKVVIVGSFQSELGCPGDWMPQCNSTALTLNSSSGLWTGTFNIPGGCHQYKVAINGTWDINYGENGIPGGANIYLYVPEKMNIDFSFDPTTHLVQTSPVASGFSINCLPQVVLAGTLQTALGCGFDWDASCVKSSLIYSAKSGLFENDYTLPGGYYEYRVVLNGDWAGGQFGSNGTPSGANYSLGFPCATKVHFAYDPISHLVKVTYDPNPQPNTVVVAGSFQSEVGCTGDWQPDCNKTRMKYDSNYGAWFSDTLLIPAGNWEYKVTLNNSWAVNYGQNGVPGGDNIQLKLCSPTKVLFGYYHNDCYNAHYIFAQILPTPPSTVVIAGSFQSELGCAGDWMPDCDKSRMKLDPYSGYWVDTLLIPAGHWEYKYAIDNSWSENYGMGSEPGGQAITLDLCYPAKVAFHFYRYNCYGWGYVDIITDGICLKKFYDPNTNGYPDPGEEPMSGVTFTLTGNGVNQSQTTSADGRAAFSNISSGEYLLVENVPVGYYSTVRDSQYVYVYGNTVVNVGNVCLGGAGAKGMGFWMNKQGKALFENCPYKEYVLQGLATLALKNADGSNFDPATWEQLVAWMQKANAKNMSYMLSAQLVTLYFNSEINMLSNRKVYTPQIKDWNAYNGFMEVYSLVNYTNYILGQVGVNPNVTRQQLESLKNLLEHINSDADFVQLHPCSDAVTNSETRQTEEGNAGALNTVAKVWPNPSNSYFTLRPAVTTKPEPLELKLYDVNGRVLYEAKGWSDRDYRFGENIIPGVYVVELIQGNQKSTIKVVKQ